MMRSNARGQHESSQSRRGFLLVVVLICLLLISMIGASLLKLGLTQHRQTRNEQNRIQSIWLAEAGIDRAAAMLRSDSKYSGETWTVSATDLSAKQPGVVQIRVKPDAESDARHVVSVVATFPKDADYRARTSKQLIVDR
jgi:Tfp pilus assembly protein PilX